ncbi:MAG TPA: glycosyltransferase [Patescibacteria group bacterium]|nr:glycosyltransferase [Patescibacteria group bacterium]
MKVALVYDRVNKWGGAERVLLALHSLFPTAPLYTSVYSKKQTNNWTDVFSVKTSFLQKIPFAARAHEAFPYLMPLAFESFDFSDYDLVISVTSEAAKGIITNNKTKHICYCLTPTRYLWSGYDFYFKNQYLRNLSQPVVRYLRKWDKIASRRPDKLIAISQEVQNRIEKYYGLNSDVIYPPLTLENKIKSIKKLDEPPFLLVISRLVPYKRIDLAIKACNRLRLPLRIIGMGSEMSYLQKIAGPTVKFLGSLTDEEVIAYYNNCRGLIFPGNEDFGLTVVEAQQYGKPVLAYKAGGAQETIIEGKTGLFFSSQSVGSVTEMLDKFSHFRYNAEDCRRQARKFSLKVFQSKFMRIVDEVMRENL